MRCCVCQVAIEFFVLKVFSCQTLSILNRPIIVPETRETRFLHFMGLFTLVKKRIVVWYNFSRASVSDQPTSHRYERFVSLQGAQLRRLEMFDVRDPFFVHRF